MTKQKIKQAAIQLFFANGYSSSSMQELAKTVGLKPSSIYGHYKSKQEILTAICLDYMKELVIGVEAVHNLRRTAYAQLVKFLEFYTQFQIKHWQAAHLVQYEYKQLNEKNLIQFKILRKTFEDYLLKIINKGIRSKKFCQIDAEIILNIFLSSMRWRHNSPKKLKRSFEENQNELFHILLQGIVYRDPENTTP